MKLTSKRISLWCNSSRRCWWLNSKWCLLNSRLKQTKQEPTCATEEERKLTPKAPQRLRHRACLRKQLAPDRGRDTVARRRGELKKPGALWTTSGCCLWTKQFWASALSPCNCCQARSTKARETSLRRQMSCRKRVWPNLWVNRKREEKLLGNSLSNSKHNTCLISNMKCKRQLKDTSSMRLLQNKRMAKATRSSKTWPILLKIFQLSKLLSFCKMPRIHKMESQKHLMITESQSLLCPRKFRCSFSRYCSKEWWLNSNSSNTFFSSSKKVQAAWTTESSLTKTWPTSSLKACPRLKRGSLIWRQVLFLLKQRRASLAHQLDRSLVQNWSASRLTSASKSKNGSSTNCWNNTSWTKKCKKTKSWRHSKQPRKWRWEMKR